MTSEKKRFRFLRRKENGQATVEFALLLPILLAFIFGIIDFGWVLFNIAMVNNTTRTCARHAIVNVESYAEVGLDGKKVMEPGTDRAKFNKTAFETNLTTKVKNELPSYMSKTAANLKLTATEVKTPSSIQETMISIRVEADIPLFTPVISTFIKSNHWHIDRTIEMRREN